MEMALRGSLYECPKLEGSPSFALEEGAGAKAPQSPNVAADKSTSNRLDRGMAPCYTGRKNNEESPLSTGVHGCARVSKLHNKNHCCAEFPFMMLCNIPRMLTYADHPNPA